MKDKEFCKEGLTLRQNNGEGENLCRFYIFIKLSLFYIKKLHLYASYLL